jgi:hypothetical protein
MKRWAILLATTVAVSVAVLGRGGLFAQQQDRQDKDSVRVPDGLGFADFRGYEGWQVVSVSQTESLLKVIVANPTMIDAYQAGIPDNGQAFPDGSRIAKIMWTPKRSTDSPVAAMVPGPLKYVDFIAKDSKRFAETGGWGYAQFNYDPAAARFTPDGTGVACGHACHTIVKANDYIFTPYEQR